MPTTVMQHEQSPTRRGRVVDAPFPIVEYLAVDLDDDAARARRLARSLLEADPRLPTTAPFGQDVRAGFAPGPCLFVEDHYAIRLWEILGNQAYSYRILLLARAGDLVAIGGCRSPAFEDYCARTLGLGEAEILQPAAPTRLESLATRCAHDPVLIGELARRARIQGGINIVPYMGSGGVWALAGAVAARAGTPVHVCAPPPLLTRRVNDKIWFSECVNRLLGTQAIPIGTPVSGSAMLAARVAQLARSHASIVVKVPDSASSKGNFLLEADSVSDRPLRELKENLTTLMRDVGWQGTFPVLVSAWERPVLVSPSVHLWIPPPTAGNPIVEAIFEQRFAGTGGRFAGAAPTALPAHWQQRLAHDATLLGVLFQHLGYIGRCSFDAILVGAQLEDASLHWIECNGRWGGVSLPLTLASRLFGDWQKRPFLIAEQSGLDGVPVDLDEVLHELEDELLSADDGQSGAVILSPSPLETGRGYEIMAVDNDLEAAAARTARVDAILRRTLLLR